MTEILETFPRVFVFQSRVSTKTVVILKVVEYLGEATAIHKYILLTKREGRTGRISARGLDSTDRAQRGPYKKTEGRYSPSTVPSKLD